MIKPNVFENPPLFKGGKGLDYYIATNSTYPPKALKNKTSGTVYLSLIVDADGTIVNVQVEKGIGDGCDEAAVRV